MGTTKGLCLEISWVSSMVKGKNADAMESLRVIFRGPKVVQDSI